MPSASTGGLRISEVKSQPSLEHRDPRKSIEYFHQENPDTEGRIHELGEDTILPARINAVDWYHTIDLPGGVVTPGVYDHRPLVAHYGLPENMGGWSALDVATFDGFWAFEMEKRGASVKALDLPRLSHIDLPPPMKELLLAEGLDREMGHGFALAVEALGSSVERLWGNIYDLDPSKIGKFDFVHTADVLLHLERPLDALRAVRSVTAGEALIVDSFDPDLEDPSGKSLTQYLGGWWTATWWLPSLQTLAQMVIDAGFSDVTVHRVYTLAKRNEAGGLWRAILKAKP